MATSRIPQPNAPGILYFDPNPTTAKLATASLRLAGYQVFYAATADTAEKLCKSHGLGEKSAIVALLLDTAADPQSAADLLGRIVKLPGANQLPGILLVSRKNPTPIPGAAGLPTLKRPFSSPALVRIINDTLASVAVATPEKKVSVSGPESHLRALLHRFFPSLKPSEQTVSEFLEALDAHEELPSAKGAATLYANLTNTRLETIMEMLAKDGARGVLSISNSESEGRLHLDRGFILLGEYNGNDEDLKLGRFIVEAGYIRTEELERFIRESKYDGEPLGQQLIEAGLITKEQLALQLARQAGEIACYLLTWREGEIYFRPSNRLHPLSIATAEDSCGSGLLIAEALLDGLRRIDESAVMGPETPSLEDVYIRIDDQIARMGREFLSRNELTILELINGRNNLKDIARRTRSGTFAVSRIVYRLGKCQLVRRRMMPLTAQA